MGTRTFSGRSPLSAIGFEVGEEGVLLLGLDDDIVDVGVRVAANLVVQAFLRATLVCSSRILQAEWHGGVAVRAIGGDEGGLELIVRVQRDLVVPGVGVEEGE